VNENSRWGPVASYGVGVWGGLTAWAALPQYVLPWRGHTLGKLGTFSLGVADQRVSGAGVVRARQCGRVLFRGAFPHLNNGVAQLPEVRYLDEVR